MTQADAAALVLQDANHPMHRREITEEIVRRGLDVWASRGPGRTPWESIGRAITQEIVEMGDASRFEYERKGSGTYRLRGREGRALLLAADTGARQVSVTLKLPVDVAEAAAREASAHEVDLPRFIRWLLEQHLAELQVRRLEAEWERSYREHPPERDETGVWETIQDWGDSWDEAE